MRHAIWNRLAAPVLACAFAAMGAGCVALDVGRPETFTHTETVTETASLPSSKEVASARGQMMQTGNRVEVGIAAEVLEKYAKTQFDETTTVRKQKRLAIGLFPGAAEFYLMPKGALDSGLGYQEIAHDEGTGYYCSLYRAETPYPVMMGAGLLMAGIPIAVCTVNSLLGQPFSGWACGHDFVDKDNLKPGGKTAYGMAFLDPSGSPKLRALAKFPGEERRKIGINTCFDRTGAKEHLPMHVGLAGIHKYLAVFVEPAKRGVPRTAGTEEKRVRHDARGPFSVELSIPALGYTHTERVAEGATRASFELPAAERGCVAEAVVKFKRDATGLPPELTRSALTKVAGREYPFEVTLQGGAVAAARRPNAPEERAPAVVSVPGKAYQVVGIRPSGNGRYEVRVRIEDRSKTFDIGWAVEPDVKRMIREDFANRHPGTGIQYVREMVEWETEEEGAILVYRGWAFSARPVSDGWTYDDGSRRGTVRLRISEGMPADEAKRWARENIEAIVTEKNVALEAGAVPPTGAVYRSLGESLENGVLTVEFEAVE